MNSRRILRLFKLIVLLVSGALVVNYVRRYMMATSPSSPVDTGLADSDPHLQIDVYDDGGSVIHPPVRKSEDIDMMAGGGRGQYDSNEGVVDIHVDPDIIVTYTHNNKLDNSSSNKQHVKLKPKSNSPVDLREFSLILNTEHLILNKDKFPNRSAENGLIIVVQVHNRAEYLIHLINSLRSVQGIEDVLLIFSHDYYNAKIFDMIHTIDFCQVMQIFFPFSMQIYENTFPGQSDNDCPRNLKKVDALKKACSNAQYPDMYGHYREAVFTMTKHHWFWKVSTVFEELPMTRNSSGLVLLIEEDHYLLPDAIHMIYKLDAERKRRSCCEIISLGDYNSPVYETNHNKMDIKTWESKAHNMAMVLDRKTWTKIKNCANMFCRYDDYNWDWSLQQVSLNCVKQPFTAIISKLPRCVHIGDCGMHHDSTGSDCNPTSRIKSITHDLDEYKRLLFPEKVMVANQMGSGKKYKIKANGGWGDIRDHALCLGFVGKSLEKNKN